MALIYPKSHVECRNSVFDVQFIRIKKQHLERLLALSTKIDDKLGCMGVPSNNRNFQIQVQGYAMLIFLPQFRTNVSLFESVICLVPGELWNF